MKMLKKNLLAVAILASAGTVSAVELSGNVALTSDYVFRGVSQSNESAAIQGGFDAAFDSGFYAGTWASSIDWGNDASTEIDVYVGYDFAVSDDISLGAAVLHYYYENEEAAMNTTELAVSADLYGLGLGVNYTDEYSAFFIPAPGDEAPSFFYYSAGYSLPVGPVSIDAHVGYSDIDDNAIYVDNSYTDWSLGVSGEAAGFGLSMVYTDTDIDGSDLASDRVVFTISKSL